MLVRRTTSPDDVHGMIAAVAVVTELGGTTSHAAVVGRALDAPCVVGCGDGTVDALVGRTVTVDATGGRVLAGSLPTAAVDESSDEDLRRLTGWAEAEVAVTVAASGDAAVEPVLDADAIPAEDLGSGCRTSRPVPAPCAVRCSRARTACARRSTRASR